jgi:hypothetical protein
MFHPATLLLAWAGFALVLPLLPLVVLAILLILVFVPAVLLAKMRTLALLRRARWLFLSIALLFAFATPGLSMPGPLGQIGMTQDGLLLAAEHLARLLLLLAMLSLLHERLGTAGFVTGLYWLLGPLCFWHDLRERIVVRLMLVVEFVESGNVGGGWREWLGEADTGPQGLMLTTRSPHWPDWLVLALLACGVGMLAW